MYYLDDLKGPADCALALRKSFDQLKMLAGGHL
jgi:hypothetical protein